MIPSKTEIDKLEDFIDGMPLIDYVVRKNNDDVFARLYEKRAHDASYMIDHENEYSEDKILR